MEHQAEHGGQQFIKASPGELGLYRETLSKVNKHRYLSYMLIKNYIANIHVTFICLVWYQLME